MPLLLDTTGTTEPPAWLTEFRQYSWYGYAVYRIYYGDGSNEHVRQWARVQEKIYAMSRKNLSDGPDQPDGDFKDLTKDTWQLHWFNDRAVFEGVGLELVKGYFAQVAQLHMGQLIDRISWRAALVVDREAFDSVSAAIEDPAREDRAFVWAADPDMDINDVHENEPEEYRYAGHYKMPLDMLKEFYRIVYDPADGKMSRGWNLALDTPWPNWKRRGVRVYL